MFHHQKSEENIVEELQSFYSLSYAPSIISNPVNVHPSLWKAPGKRSVISPIFLHPVDVFPRVLSHPPVVSAPSFSPSSASLRICVTRVDFGVWMWGWAAGRQKSGRRRWKKGNDDILSSEKKAKEGKPETFRDLSQRLFFISLFWFEESSNSTLINLFLTAAASCLRRDNHW